jgi:hypothetical protein
MKLVLVIRMNAMSAQNAPAVYQEAVADLIAGAAMRSRSAMSSKPAGRAQRTAEVYIQTISAKVSATRHRQQQVDTDMGFPWGDQAGVPPLPVLTGRGEFDITYCQGSSGSRA